MQTTMERTFTRPSPPPKPVVPTTIREKVLHSLHQRCRREGLQFYMSTHFIDRINIRAGDQDETFLNLAKSVHFIMARREEFQSLRIGIQIDAHFFFLRLDDNNKFACLTYYYNPTRTTFPEGADKKFKLTSERSNDEV